MSEREAGEQWIADLNRIDWGTIEHAYGPAADVPGLIPADVRGGDDAIRACGELSNNLNHQGSIYPATGPAVPFLIEALRATAAGPRVRAGLLGVLGGIAGGAAAWIDNDSPGTSGEDGISFRDVFAAVWRGAGLYAQLLANDPDADARMHAAHVWACSSGPGRRLPRTARPGSVSRSEFSSSGSGSRRTGRRYRASPSR